jgi:predicted acyltransferase
MGVAMALAFARGAARPSARNVYPRIGRRALVLIVLGLVLNAVAAWPGVSPLRLPGVLQRIALAYLIAAPVILHLRVPGWAVAAAVLLLGHWALLALVPFGGYPGGTLLPEQNLARHVDELILGRHALAIPNDPEGLLGTLPAAATALVGALAGRIILGAPDERARMGRLAGGGAAALALGLVWSFALPVSKPLWTGSFVLVTAGLGSLALAVTDGVMGVRVIRSCARPFLWLGVNPLAIYVFSDIAGHLIEKVWTGPDGGQTTVKAWLFWRLLEPVFHPWSPEWASLAFAMAFSILWMAVAGGLYWRQIRISV